MKSSKANADLIFLHLQAARLNLLLQRQVLRLQASLPPADGGWNGFHLSANQALGMLQRPFFHPPAPLPKEQAKPFAAAIRQADANLRAHLAQATEPPRFCQLAQRFDLSSFEQDVLLLAIVVALDSRAATLCGFLHDDLTRKRPSFGLAIDLFTPPAADRLAQLRPFAPDQPLMLQRLIQPIPVSPTPFPIETPFACDETVLHWLLHGRYQPAPALHAALAISKSKLSQPAASDSLHEGSLLTGPDRLRRLAAAEQLAAQAGQPLLTLTLARLAADELGQSTAVSHLLRDARLTHSLPCIDYDGVALQADGLEPLREAEQAVLLTGRQPLPPTLLAGQRPFQQRHYPLPTPIETVSLLEELLPPKTEVELTAVASQFRLSTAQWQAVGQQAVRQTQWTKRPLTEADLFAAARAQTSSDLGHIARKIRPRFAWADLILPDDQIALLRELVATVRQRAFVLGTWGVGQKLAASAGITSLFAGPPGTGKTMAAEVIAAELQLDLYKIDLAALVSKYIGETEKNLDKLFTAAESSNAILFFDEADAIFGKRSEVQDAHDRYANIEVSYLLQRMEQYDGVTILATNLRANLDEAFTRRLQFALDFPFPQEGDRLRLWQTLFPPDLPCATDLDLPRLAERFELAGGNIRNIIVSAAYLAAENGCIVTNDHLLHGVRREMQKMGRLISEDMLQF